MKRLHALLLLLAAGSVCAADLPSADPASAGFLPDRLERIDRAILAEIESGAIPGAVALVARNGSIVYHRSFGYADIDEGEEMRNDSIFRIASMSKAITTVAVMMLQEQGKLDLQDPLSKYIPAFADPEVVVTDENGKVTETRKAKSAIRIIDLVTHTSGIGYPFIPSALQQAYADAGIIDGLTASDRKLGPMMERLAELPLLFDPGTDFAYGLNTDVLGYLVEVVSGRPLDGFFREEIFAPLQMNDTAFYLPREKAGRLVTLYADVDGLRESTGQEGDLKMDNPNYPIEGAKSYFSGGAGLSSTASDYARFLQMLLNEGELDGVRLLGRKSVELLRSPRVDRDDDGDADMGLGFAVVSDLGEWGRLGSPGMYSWGGAFNTTFWIDPQEGLVAVLMTQVRPSTTTLGDRFRTMVYQALQ